MAPKASFVIPTRDCVAWLPFAINSALSQTVRDIEVLVVNDGSKDSTQEYLAWAVKQDKRLRVIETGGVGRSTARNQGNAQAQADIIFVLDADDVALPKRVEYSLALISKGAEYVYGSTMAVNALATMSRKINADVTDLGKILKNENHDVGIVHSSVAYKRDLALKFPYRLGEICKLGLDDWAQQIEVLNSGAKMDFVPNIICQYRNLMGAISSTRSRESVMEEKKRFLRSLGLLEVQEMVPV